MKLLILAVLYHKYFKKSINVEKNLIICLG